MGRGPAPGRGSARPGGSTRDPRACTGRAGPGLPEPAALAARNWMGALGAGAGPGDRSRVSGDPATTARVRAPRAPPGGPAPTPPPGMRAQVPEPAGSDLGQGDPGRGWRVRQIALLRRWMGLTLLSWLCCCHPHRLLTSTMRRTDARYSRSVPECETRRAEPT
ncbi:EMI domain-containing protein 1-like [Equus quagga]|uniref:EMI domain-containing protein 1-like n=1 Tax=Equus quagga TaxID=89248 RepID=UPI001EE18A99|nr:EMI domain-containing protein 1-like [Equus quagga]